MLTAAALLQAAVAPIATTPVRILIALGTTLPVLVRRTHPVAAAFVSTAAGLIPSDGFVYVGYVVSFIVFYSAAVYVLERRRLIAVVAAGVVLAILGSAIHGAVFGDYFAALSAVIAPAIVGRFVRHQRLQARRLEELARHLESERERNVARALDDERRRIARELHDVVAHTITVIAVQADAAEAALHISPERARTPLQTIRSSAGEALIEMRRLLAVLRVDDDERGVGAAADSRPTVRAARPDSQPRRRRDAGRVRRRATAAAERRPLRLPDHPGALTNVRKHAGGAPASVRLDWKPRSLELEVRNAVVSRRATLLTGASRDTG